MVNMADKVAAILYRRYFLSIAIGIADTFKSIVNKPGFFGSSPIHWSLQLNMKLPK
jgi:hypothetical protein